MEENSDSESYMVTPKKAKLSKSKRLQKYKSEWEKVYDWLHGDSHSQFNAKCKICNISFTIGTAGIGQVRDTGNTGSIKLFTVCVKFCSVCAHVWLVACYWWRVLCSYFQVKQHQDTKQHKSKSNIKNTSTILERFFGSSSSSESLESNDSLKNTVAELALTYHTVKHNLSYNSMDCNIKLHKMIFADSKTAINIHLARTKMEALVTEVLGPYAIQSIIDILNNENLFYCLQTDASNKKNIKLFPLVVQYFTITNGIQNKLLDFYENSDESADGMFKAINDSMNFYKLSFDQVSALSADNTNANYGVHHSLYTNMTKQIPDLIKGNCHAHIIHNTVKHAMQFLDHDVENVILKIYSHFSVSAVRREELKKFVKMVEGDFHEFKRHVGTRWLSLLPCIDTILLNWEPIHNYFQSLGNDCPMIIQNILMLNSIEYEDHDIIEIYLLFTSNTLHIFNKTIKCLEGNCITILDVYNIMNNLKKELMHRKADMFFGFNTRQKLRHIEQSSPELFHKINRNFLLFVDKCFCYLEKWFDFSQTNWLYLLSNISLKTPIEFDNLDKIIERLNLQKLNINMDQLYSEIKVLNELYTKIFNDEDFRQKSTCEKWQYIFQTAPDDFINIFKVISYLLSVPATSAFTERVFSVMNVKWRDERNKASLNLIKNELFIYFNMNIECNDAIKIFQNNKMLLCTAKSNAKYVWKK